MKSNDASFASVHRVGDPLFELVSNVAFVFSSTRNFSVRVPTYYRIPSFTSDNGIRAHLCHEFSTLSPAIPWGFTTVRFVLESYDPSELLWPTLNSTRREPQFSSAIDDLVFYFSEIFRRRVLQGTNNFSSPLRNSNSTDDRRIRSSAKARGLLREKTWVESDPVSAERSTSPRKKRIIVPFFLKPESSGFLFWQVWWFRRKQWVASRIKTVRDPAWFTLRAAIIARNSSYTHHTNRTLLLTNNGARVPLCLSFCSHSYEEFM